MKAMTAAEVAVRIGATLVGDPHVLIGPQVVIDSRKVDRGCLFIALVGERVDGHEFVSAALAAGAGAAVVARALPVAGTQLVVTDPGAALAQLARTLVIEGLSEGLITVAITGSSGKTSTKDLVGQVLEVAASTVAPVGSQNNEIGVPLTATRIDTDTRFLVSEFGARGLGHIRWLCEIVPPQIGVVINVGQAHVGEFGDQATIATAKGELVEALPDDGWAVLNAQDPNVAAMATRTRAHVATFAVGEEPDFGELRVWATDAHPDELLRESFTLHAAGVVTGSAPVTLRVSGAHQMSNAVAAASVALLCGMELTTAAAALGRAEAQSRWRMEITETRGGFLVVNDAYNANPDSMRAALDSLAGLRRPGGRLIAVLGDMLELGAAAARRHVELGELAVALGVDSVIAIGEYATDLAHGVRSGGGAVQLVSDAADATQAALKVAHRGDVVLVKASRGLALESVAQGLIEGVSAESDR